MPQFLYKGILAIHVMSLSIMRLNVNGVTIIIILLLNHLLHLSPPIKMSLNVVWQWLNNRL